jgi:hypothetical protein
MPLQLEEFTPALADAETALLGRAFAEWNLPDAQFSDAEVARVKALFARVFGVADAARLVGHPIADALLLYERGGCGAYYAAVRVGASWVWKRLAVVSSDDDRVLVRSEILDPSIPFDMLVAFLSG